MRVFASWSPAPFVRGSCWLHGTAVAGLVFVPSWWKVCAGTLVINHLVLSAAGLWPRSKLLGPNWTHLPEAAAARKEVAVTLDDGPDPRITPAVLDVLDRFGAKATFFCIGEKVRRHPELAADIVRRGHTIENHSEHHSHRFSFSGWRGFRREIQAAQVSIAEVTGRYPAFFRAPAGLRNPFLEPVLSDMNLRLVSWTRRGFDTVRHDADRVSRSLLHKLGAGDILLLHDGNAARNATGQAVVLEALPKVLQAVRSQGLRPVTLLQAST